VSDLILKINFRRLLIFLHFHQLIKRTP